MALLRTLNNILILALGFLPLVFNRTILNAFFVPQATFFVFVVALIFILNTRRIWGYTRESLGLLLLYLAFLISGFTACNKSEFLYFISIWSGYVVYVFYMQTLKHTNPNFFKKFVLFLGYTTAIPIFYGILQYIGIDFHWKLKSGYKLISTFGNPNAFTHFAVLALPFHLYISAVFKRKTYLAFAALDAISLILAGSRAGLGILFINIVLLLIFFLKGKYKIGFLILLLLFSIMNRGKITRFRIDKIRFLIYRSSIEMIRDNPLIGVGAGNYKIIYQKYRSAEEHYRHSGESTKVAKAHNIFIEYSAEGGILALSLFVLYILLLFRIRKDIFIRILILNFLLDGVVSFNYINTTAMFLFFTGTLLTAKKTPQSFSSFTLPKPLYMFLTLVMLFLALFQIKYYMAEVLYTQASRYEHYKQYRPALRAFIKTGRFNPHYFDSYKKTAFLFWSKFSDYRNAILYFRRFIQYSPAEFSVLHDIGFCYDHLKDKIRAVYFYRKSLELDPYYPLALGNLANAYYDLNNYQMAKIMYLRIIKLGLHTVAAYNNLGNTYQSLGDLVSARKMYLKVLELNPNVFETLYNVSYIEYRLGLFNEALEHINRAQKIAPNNPHVKRLKMRILQNTLKK